MPDYENIAFGEVPGIAVVHKFGVNPVVSTTEEDVWFYGGDLIWPSSAVTLYQASNDDTATQTICWHGLDANFEEVSVEVALTGQTPVIVGSASNWRAIHRGYQVSSGAVPSQDVYISQDNGDFTLGVPQTATNVAGMIDFTSGANQTEQALYMVPAGKQALVTHVDAVMGDTTGTSRTATVYLQTSELASGASVSSPSWAPLRTRTQFSIRSDGESSVDRSLITAPIFCGPLTRIQLRASATANSRILGRFDLRLRTL